MANVANGVMTVVVIGLGSMRRIELAEERNVYCLREIGYFLDFALNGAVNINSIPYANDIIGFVLKAASPVE